MIQRIQSVLLLFSGLGFLGQFLTDLATSSQALASLFADQKYEIQDSPVLLGITLAGAILAILTIFLYQNRKLQSQLSGLVLILGISLPLAAFFIAKPELDLASTSTELKAAMGAALPALSIVLSALAMRFIKKDDKLVKSMERLR
ncbi:MAG: DUF4293 family protein [Saprospiraceae bacterium]|nr:DUF4293 family protein [Saprospiraceae bacterium]